VKFLRGECGINAKEEPAPFKAPPAQRRIPQEDRRGRTQGQHLREEQYPITREEAWEAANAAGAGFPGSRPYGGSSERAHSRDLGIGQARAAAARKPNAGEIPPAEAGRPKDKLAETYERGLFNADMTSVPDHILNEDGRNSSSSWRR